MQQVGKADILRKLDETAKAIAARQHIPYAQAYRQLLESDARFYDFYLQERDSHGPGTSAARQYVEAVDRLTARRS